MSRLNVYLPDDLAAAARQAGVNVSAVTQAALRHTLATRSTDMWLSTLATGSPAAAVSHDQALQALDDARDEFAASHD